MIYVIGKAMYGPTEKSRSKQRVARPMDATGFCSTRMYQAAGAVGMLDGPIRLKV
jgi:hypothetical protein